MAKILIVDDTVDIAELISEVLIDEGYETVIKNNGFEALEETKKTTFDLILLDIMMPDMTGIEVLNKIRTQIACPIIFITAKAQILDKLLGFELGADDYITKPFITEELVARVKAHLRRDHRKLNNNSSMIKIGAIELNKDSYEVKKNNKLISLSTREFELLAYLITNAGNVLAKEQIFNSVWGTNYGEIGTVAVHINSLRKKLDPKEEYIKTVWGVGYKFVKVGQE